MRLQVRPNVADSAVSGMCLGLVYGLGGQGMKASKVTECFPALVKFINHAVKVSLPKPEKGDLLPGASEFTWSSLQLNFFPVIEAERMWTIVAADLAAIRSRRRAANARTRAR